jgi:uncharacterized cupin superfamily protein
MNLRDRPLHEGENPAGFARRGESLTQALGGELIGCGLYDVHPGEQLWPYHYHWNNEEWLIVVDGTPALRTPEGERELRPGDVVAFVEGEEGAHTLYNRGESPFRVAIFSTRRRGSVVYPDSGKVAVSGKCYRIADAVDYWEGEAD